MCPKHLIGLGSCFLAIFSKFELYSSAFDMLLESFGFLNLHIKREKERGRERERESRMSKARGQVV
jgi:hypothetical protein